MRAVLVQRLGAREIVLDPFELLLHRGSEGVVSWNAGMGSESAGLQASKQLAMRPKKNEQGGRRVLRKDGRIAG